MFFFFSTNCNPYFDLKYVSVSIKTFRTDAGNTAKLGVVTFPFDFNHM